MRITWCPPAVGRSRASRFDLTRQVPVRSWISWRCGRRDRSYTVVGKTGLVTLAGTGLETFPANISVRAGDILGFWARPGLHSGFPNCARSVPSGGGYLQSSIATNPKVGDTVTFAITASFFDLNESATF